MSRWSTAAAKEADAMLLAGGDGFATSSRGRAAAEAII